MRLLYTGLILRRPAVETVSYIYNKYNIIVLDGRRTVTTRPLKSFYIIWRIIRSIYILGNKPITVKGVINILGSARENYREGRTASYFYKAYFIASEFIRSEVMFSGIISKKTLGLGLVVVVSDLDKAVLDVMPGQGAYLGRLPCGWNKVAGGIVMVTGRRSLSTFRNSRY